MPAGSVHLVKMMMTVSVLIRTEKGKVNTFQRILTVKPSITLGYPGSGNNVGMCGTSVVLPGWLVLGVMVDVCDIQTLGIK